MYIEIHDWTEIEQKMLYFKLNNALNINEESETNHKYQGVYAISKGGICLYVGQSKNIASRLATHLKGKYKDSTIIHIWTIEDLGFSNFVEKEKETQQAILDNCEKYIMTKLKPIENIAIDMDFKLEESKTPDISVYEEYRLVKNEEILRGYCSPFKIQVDKKSLAIYDIDDSYFINQKIGKLAEKVFFMPKEFIYNNELNKLHEDIFNLCDTDKYLCIPNGETK